jgi:hypothetical protein
MDYLKAAKTSAAPDVGSIDVSKEHYIAALSALHRRGDEMHVNFVEAMRIVGDCFYDSSGCSLFSQYGARPPRMYRTRCVVHTFRPVVFPQVTVRAA